MLATPVGRELVTRFRATRLDLLILLGLTVLAAVPRLVLLTDIPPGFHGDEAWTGIDARRVLDEGWIGPYVISALGQPAGPLYFAAPIVGLLGDSVFSVRLSMALLAIVTVPVAYLTFRVMFGRTLGTFAAILLALGLWHLHFSRIGFMVISWPLMELVTLLFLFLGIKTRRWLFFGLAGLAFGAGIYTYNAYPIFALPFGVFIVWLALRYRGRDLIRYGGQVTLMAGLAIFAALATFGLMLTGSYVSGSGAGLAFRDWPLFNGQLMPEGGRLAMIHAGHRMAAAGVGLLIVYVAVRAWREQRWHRPVLVTTLFALALYGAQVMVGAANIWTLLQPSASATHLALAVALWATLVTASLLAHRATQPLPQTGDARAGRASPRRGTVEPVSATLPAGGAS